MDMVNVRAAVEQMDHEIAALAAPSSVLRDAWSQLVGALALEPAQATRECPHCGNVGMRAATLCGYCGKKVVPPGEANRCGDTSPASVA